MEDKIIFNEEDVKRILALVNWDAVKVTSEEEEYLELLRDNGSNAGEALAFDEHSQKLKALLNAQGECEVLVYNTNTKKMRRVVVNTEDGYLDLRQLVE